MRNSNIVSRSLGWGFTLTLLGQLLVAQAPPAGGGGTPAPGPTTGGGSTTPGGGSPGGVGTPGRPGTQFPSPTDRNQQQMPQEMQRPIFLSGKVTLEDGTPPPEPVTIERVCNGQPRPEGYTNSKGHFSFQLGQNNGMFADASVGNANDPFGGGIGGSSSRGNMGGFGGGNTRQITERELMGCELRAVLPGYRSEMVPLSGRRFMDNPEVGTIILRRLGNVEGLTVSVTSAMAPKDSKKAYEKGRDLARKNKFPEAQKEYEKAVASYEKYANAWYELGMVHEAQKHTDEARKAYEMALAADPKLVKPYVKMAWIYARENKWQEVATASDRAVKLNPYDFTDAYFLSAVANLNLQKLDAAEKSAREGIKLDSNNKIPKMRHVLGLVLAQKQDYAGAADNMKGYISTLAPDAADLAMVKTQLAQIEKFLGEQAKTTAPAQAQQQ